MRVIKSVSFSMIDDYETGLFNHAKKNGKFGPYIKRLIARDMENRPPVIRQAVVDDKVNAKKSFM